MTDLELNEAVARKLGWKVNKPPYVTTGYKKGERWIIDTELPAYSTSIEAAWEVVEHMSQQGIGTYLFGGITESWHCDLHTHPAGNDDPMVSESADTAPRAICESFLKLP